MALQFNDASQFINAPSATILDINATDEIELNATLVDVNANLDVSGTLAVAGGVTLSGTISGTTITATTAFVPDASDGAALGTASLQFSDLFLADGAIIKLGDDQDTTLTHVADAGILLNSTRQLQFGDSGTYIHQSADGVLDLVSDTEIEINATTIDINGAAEISGNLAVGGTLGATGATTLSGTLAVTGATTLAATSFGETNITNVGDIALDSISADGTDINVAVSDNSATALTIKQGSNAYLIIDTANSSESVSIGTGISGTAITLGHATSEVTVGDNLTITGDLTVNGTTTTVNSTSVTVDDPVITLGGDTAPSSDDNKDRGVEFRYHDGSAARVGFFGWDDSATAFTFLTVATNSSEVFSGTAGNLAGLGTIGSGAITSTGAIQGTSYVVANGGNIGSVGDTDSIAIASDGVVTLTQKLVGTELDISGAIDVAGTTNLDVVDIDGAVQVDATVTVGVNDTGYDVKFFGDTASAFMLWDASADDLILSGDAGLVIPVNQLNIGGTLVSASAAQLNLLSSMASIDTDLSSVSGSDDTLASAKAIKALVSASANVTGLNATGAEINAVADADAVNTAGIDTTTAITNTDGLLVFDKSAAAIGYFDVDLLDTYFAASTKTLTNKTLTAPVIADNGIISDGTNELLRFQAIGSAVNELEISNASTGNGPTIGAAGETDVGINLTAKGTGVVNVTSTTASSSSTTGSLIVGGGLGVAADLFVGDDFDVTGDAVIDGTTLVTGVLTTTAATVFNGGSRINTNKKLEFRDANLHISSTTSGQLDIVANTEIQIAATTIDINGAVDISGATTQTGISTSAAKDVFNAGMSVKNGATTAGFIEFFEDSNNGANKVTLVGPAATADVTVILPASAGTLATTASAADEATALAIALG